jgi:15-cis-phytoene synthase
VSVTLAQAYGLCESITRERAANFYYGIRLLPRDRRRAMCAAYAFARRVDDIGDGLLPASEKLLLLEQAEASLGALGGGADGPDGPDGADPVLVALADAGARFAFPPQALAELVAGVRMDVLGTTYESFDQLVPYCRNVAGTIGRVCLAIFTDGDAGAREAALADDLGVALQLTNILRDVREDAESGRVYLPAEDFHRFEVIAAPLAPQPAEVLAAMGSVESSRRFATLVEFEAARAQEWFERGGALVALLDRRSAACVAAMAGIYRRVLRRIAQEPRRVLRERVSLPAREKAWVAAGAMAGRLR